MSIYDSLIKGIEQTKSSSLGIADYLKSLQPTMKELRKSYFNKPVYVPYHREDIQSAYLIAYLPHYYNLIYSILLNEGEEIFGDKEEINIGFIGGGPGSEVYGVIKYILNNRPTIKRVNIVVFDINASTWGFSHKIVKDYLIKEIDGSDNITLTWTTKKFDLTSSEDIISSQSIFKKLHLLVVQNCLNEIASNQFEQLKVNIESIFNGLPGKSFFLMSDLTSGARDVIKKLETTLDNTGLIRYKNTTLDQSYPLKTRSINPAPSPLIRSNLLIGSDGLIPRVNLTYDYSLLSKEHISAKRELLEEAGFMALYNPLAHNQIDVNNYVHTKTFVGIDFGTSTTVVSIAYLNGDKLKVESVPITQREPDKSETSDSIVPSVIAIKNNVFMVGKHASERKNLMIYGENIWYDFKENLDSLENLDFPKSVLRNNANFRVNNSKDALVLFFKYIKKEVQEYLRKRKELPVEMEFAISIPAGFDSNKKIVILDCLKSASIETNDSPFIDEPIAALINYIFESNYKFSKLNKNTNVIVVDIGAGTVDVSIIGLSRNKEGLNSQLLSISRKGYIGGNYLDELVFDQTLPPLYKAGEFFGNEDLDEISYRKFKKNSELLKIKLCSHVHTDSSVNFKLPEIAFSDNIMSVDNLCITFNEFHRIMEEYWVVLKETINDCLNKSELSTENIDLVILTGGGSRNPYLQNFTRKMFVESLLIRPDNIQEHVSKGTALHSFILNSYGKNIISPLIYESIFIEGTNKIIEIFTPGENIPSIDKNVYPLNFNNLKAKAIRSYYGKEKNNIKYFIIPAGVKIEKLIFFVDYDQELKCEYMFNDNVINLETCFHTELNLIDLK